VEQRRPAWWSEGNSSSWDRMKAAIRRDWEQTKADFGGVGSGKDLNQNAGDTVRQASGKQPVPPVQMPNSPSPDDLHRHAKMAAKADQKAEKFEGKAAATSPGTRESERLQRKAYDARKVAMDADHDLQRNQNRRWEDVEDAVQYGFMAGLHHKADWSDRFDQDLKKEWKEMYPDRDWNDMKDYVRVGWDRASGFRKGG